MSESLTIWSCGRMSFVSALRFYKGNFNGWAKWKSNFSYTFSSSSKIKSKFYPYFKECKIRLLVAEKQIFVPKWIFVIVTSLHFTIFDGYIILSQSVIIGNSIVNEVIECNKSMQKGLSGGCGWTININSRDHCVRLFIWIRTNWRIYMDSHDSLRRQVISRLNQDQINIIEFQCTNIATESN